MILEACPDGRHSLFRHVGEIRAAQCRGRDAYLVSMVEGRRQPRNRQIGRRGGLEIDQSLKRKEEKTNRRLGEGGVGSRKLDK